MRRHGIAYLLIAAMTAGLAACGGGTAGNGMATQQAGTVPLVISDASSDDWATVGVKVLSIALVPQGGGSDATVYSATSAAPYVNLVQLDQVAEVLGNVTVPVGTYSSAIVTVSANPGDVLLVTSANPESGFAGAPSTQIPSSSIQVQHAQGSSGNLSVPVNVSLISPLVVSTTSSNALDLEFDLSHPAFIIAHQPPGSGTLLWAVNFAAPIRHHPIAAVTQLLLRHLYGGVTSVSSDGSSLTVNKLYPTLPAVSPETAVTSSQSLDIQVDSTNGTLLYDLDTGSSSTIHSFSGVSGLAAGEYLRVAARYQQNGTLVATRIWESSNFGNVWVSPEGHVLDVDATNGDITVVNEAGQPVQLAIDGTTQFYFHDGITPIGSGTAFLGAGNLVRGFKIDATINPLSMASPAVATSVNIETAVYSGALSAANTTGFTYTHDDPVRTNDDYTVTLNYISPSSMNGTDASGNPITGFKWWNFAFPTLITAGSSAISQFVSATSSTTLTAYGASFATWGDPANASGWSAPLAVLEPVPVPLASVSSPLIADTFMMTTLGSATSYTVNVNSAGGEATLVYQVDRTNGIVTVSPVDLTTTGGLNQFTDAMVSGTLVKAYGVPQPNGSLQAYVVLYYTGTMPQD